MADVLCQENVLDGTKLIPDSRIGQRGCVRRSDSSAQVLRNSRLEFRLPPHETVEVRILQAWMRQEVGLIRSGASQFAS